MIWGCFTENIRMNFPGQEETLISRANELAVAGLLAPSYIQEVLLPVILETQETLNRIKKDLDSLTQKAVRI